MRLYSHKLKARTKIYRIRKRLNSVACCNDLTVSKRHRLQTMVVLYEREQAEIAERRNRNRPKVVS